MPKKWNEWKDYFEKNDDWQYEFEERKINYPELKKMLIAGIAFILLYGAHLSDTRLALMVDDSVGYLVNTKIDFAILKQQAENYIPTGMNQEMLQRVKSVVAQPADPLSYMSMPVHGEVMTAFSSDSNGVEYKTETDSSVKAASIGKVKAVTKHDKYGNLVVLEHGQALETVYGYLSEVFVKEGEHVSQGQTIGKSGKKSADNKSNFYFEMREKGIAIDPLTRIKGDFPSQGGK